MNEDFVQAIKNGDISKCFYMLNANPDLVNSAGTETPDGKKHLSVLMLAISRNKNDIVKLLVERGADLEYQVKSTGDTPLHIALGYNNKDIIEYLVKYMNDNNINTNIKNNKGESFMDIYVDNESRHNKGFLSAIAGLKESGAGEVILGMSDDFRDYRGDSDEEDYDEGGGKKRRKLNKRRKSNKKRKTSKKRKSSKKRKTSKRKKSN